MIELKNNSYIDTIWTIPYIEEDDCDFLAILWKKDEQSKMQLDMRFKYRKTKEKSWMTVEEPGDKIEEVIKQFALMAKNSGSEFCSFPIKGDIENSLDKLKLIPGFSFKEKA